MYSGEDPVGEGERIWMRALDMCDEPVPNEPCHKQICEAIERLYGFLDLLDRKANSLITLNSFMIAIAGVVAFRPTITEGTTNTISTLQSHALISGAVAILVAGACIIGALQIFSIRWKFMKHHSRDGSEQRFFTELQELGRVAANRQFMVRLIRWATFFVCALVGITFAFSLVASLMVLQG